MEIGPASLDLAIVPVLPFPEVDELQVLLHKAVDPFPTETEVVLNYKALKLEPRGSEFGMPLPVAGHPAKS